MDRSGFFWRSCSLNIFPCKPHSHTHAVLCFHKRKLGLSSSSSLEEASARLFLSPSSSNLEYVHDIYCLVIVQFQKCAMVGETESINVQFCNVNINTKASSLQLRKRWVPGPMLFVTLLYLWMWRSALLQGMFNCPRFTCLKCFKNIFSSVVPFGLTVWLR